MINRRHASTLLAAAFGAAALPARAQTAQPSPKDLERLARVEGKLASVGMPDDWANWRGTWADLQRLYGVAHVDSDMSSAEEIAKIEAEKANASVDIGDVGFEFGAIAKARGVTRAVQAQHLGTGARLGQGSRTATGPWPTPARSRSPSTPSASRACRAAGRRCSSRTRAC